MEQGEHVLRCHACCACDAALTEAWSVVLASLHVPHADELMLGRSSYLYYETYSQYNIQLGTRLAVSLASCSWCYIEAA